LGHGLALTEERVREARRCLYEQNLYGQASVEMSVLKSLPYADNLVNLLILDGVNNEVLTADKLTLQETLRVICPEGVMILGGRPENAPSEQELRNTLNSAGIENFEIIDRQNGLWAKVIKPRPSGMDEWIHYGYDASSVCVSQDEVLSPLVGVRWMAGPYSAHMGNGGTKVAVSSGGRLFYISWNNTENLLTKRTPKGEYLIADKGCLIARDAYNGLMLWSKFYSGSRQYGDRFLERVVLEMFNKMAGGRRGISGE
jgi:hypothetical protein